MAQQPPYDPYNPNRRPPPTPMAPPVPIVPSAPAASSQGYSPPGQAMPVQGYPPAAGYPPAVPIGPMPGYQLVNAGYPAAVPPGPASGYLPGGYQSPSSYAVAGSANVVVNPIVMAPRTSGWAIWSFVCSLLALCTGLPAILGVIFGHVALADMRKNPMVTGKGLAITGLIISYGIIALGVIWFLFVVVLGAALMASPGSG